MSGLKLRGPCIMVQAGLKSSMLECNVYNFVIYVGNLPQVFSSFPPNTQRSQFLINAILVEESFLLPQSISRRRGRILFIMTMISAVFE